MTEEIDNYFKKIFTFLKKEQMQFLEKRTDYFKTKITKKSILLHF